MSSVQSRDDRFIEWLEGFRDSVDGRGVLAKLRRGLSKPPGSDIGMYPYVVPFIAPGDSRWQQECYFSIASLFALHPQSGGRGNMGTVMRQVSAATDSKSVEARFVALLNSHQDDLHRRLRHAVSLAASKDIPVCWKSLLRDVKWWSYESRYVQKKWAREFWGSVETDEKTKLEEENVNEG